jgi:HK97 family phage portal protein
MFTAMPQYMWVVPDKTNYIKGYLFERNGEKAAFLHPQDERSHQPGAFYCIHLKYPSLLSPYYGVGPVEAGAYAMDTNLYMAQYNTALFKNGAFPGMVVETEERINETLEEELKERWEAAYRGVSKAGKILMLSYGYKVKGISLTPQQLTLLELMNITKEQIFMMFGTPLSMAGERSGVSKSGGDWANYDFYRSVVNPDATMIKLKLQNNLVDRWDAKSVLELGYKDIVPKDEQMEHKRRKENAEAGIITFNEARSDINLPDTDWGKEPLVNNQLVPITSIIENPNNPAVLAQEAAKLAKQQSKQNPKPNDGKGGKNG